MHAADDFVVPTTIWAIAALSNSSDRVWFIRIKEPCIAETLEEAYGHVIVVGQCYIIGNFLEKSRSNSKEHYFKVGSKTSYFYHEKEE